jgi:hypothetical protein
MEWNDYQPVSDKRALSLAYQLTEVWVNAVNGQ